MSAAPANLSRSSLARRYPLEVDGGRSLNDLLGATCALAGTVPALMSSRIAALEGEEQPDLSSLHGVLFVLDSVASALRAAHATASQLPALSEPCTIAASPVTEGMSSIFQVQPIGTPADLIAAAADLAVTTAAMLRDELALRGWSETFTVLGLYGIQHAAAALDAFTVAAHEAYKRERRVFAVQPRGMQ